MVFWMGVKDVQFFDKSETNSVKIIWQGGLLFIKCNSLVDLLGEWIVDLDRVFDVFHVPGISEMNEFGSDALKGDTGISKIEVFDMERIRIM